MEGADAVEQLIREEEGRDESGLKLNLKQHAHRVAA